MPGAYTFPVDPRESCFEEQAEDAQPFACKKYRDGTSESKGPIGEQISFLIDRDLEQHNYPNSSRI